MSFMAKPIGGVLILSEGAEFPPITAYHTLVSTMTRRADLLELAFPRELILDRIQLKPGVYQAQLFGRRLKLPVYLDQGSCAGLEAARTFKP